MDIKSYISKHGLKVTHQRVAVIEAIMKNNNHPCVEDLFKELSQNVHGLSKATLYNILEQFCEKGILKKITTMDGKLRYDLKHLPHHHIHNINDGTITDYYDDEINEIITNYFKNKHFDNLEIVDISLEIKAKPIKF